MPARIKSKLPAIVGHPSRLTPTLITKICATVQGGSPPYTASKVHAVPDPTFKEWLKRGREGEEPFASLVAGIAIAQAKCEDEEVGFIRTAARQGAWGGAAWLLERQAPQHWHQESRLMISGDPDNPIVIEKEIDTSPEKIAEVLLIAERLKGNMTAGVLLPGISTIIDVTPDKPSVAVQVDPNPPPDDGLPVFRERV